MTDLIDQISSAIRIEIEDAEQRRWDVTDRREEIVAALRASAPAPTKVPVNHPAARKVIVDARILAALHKNIIGWNDGILEGAREAASAIARLIEGERG